MDCLKCHKPVQDGWKLCPECEEPLPSAAASIHVQDGIAGRVEQKVKGISPTLHDRLMSVAKVELKDSVVKEIHQTVNLHLTSESLGLDVLSQIGDASHLRAELLFLIRGREVLGYRVDDPSPKPCYRLELPDELGGGRSIGLTNVGDSPHLLVGCRKGVALIEQATKRMAIYPLPEVTRGGVNAMSVVGEDLYATHSDFGLLRWKGPLTQAEVLFPNLIQEHATVNSHSTVRGALLDARGHLLFCAGKTAFSWNFSDPKAEPLPFPTDTDAALIGVVEGPGCLYGADGSGNLHYWKRALPNTRSCIARALGCTAYTLCTVPRGRSMDLVVGAKSSRLLRYHVEVADPENPAEVPYPAPGGSTLRLARAAPDLFAATDRSGGTLYLWRRDQPRATPREIAVSSESTRTDIHDFCIRCR